ncbi:hypothetical protein J6590_051800 [Homalodisca vitripennis]|nr:hypothetical protein J6590_051800 [Homalodisca vitripennis]
MITPSRVGRSTDANTEPGPTDSQYQCQRDESSINSLELMIMVVLTQSEDERRGQLVISGGSSGYLGISDASVFPHDNASTNTQPLRRVISVDL